MAYDSVRAQLDALMGADRNGSPSHREPENFHDKQVCKDYLVGLCPSSLFGGVCTLTHSDDLKRDYENSRDRGRLGYERNLATHLKRMVADADRRISRHVRRLKGQYGVDRGLEISGVDALIDIGLLRDGWETVNDVKEEVEAPVNAMNEFQDVNGVADAKKNGVQEKIDKKESETGVRADKENSGESAGEGDTAGIKLLDVKNAEAEDKEGRVNGKASNADEIKIIGVNDETGSAAEEDEIKILAPLVPEDGKVHSTVGDAENEDAEDAAGIKILGMEEMESKEASPSAKDRGIISAASKSGATAPPNTEKADDVGANQNKEVPSDPQHDHKEKLANGLKEGSSTDEKAHARVTGKESEIGTEDSLRKPGAADLRASPSTDKDAQIAMKGAASHTEGGEEDEGEVMDETEVARVWMPHITPEGRFYWKHTLTHVVTWAAPIAELVINSTPVPPQKPKEPEDDDKEEKGEGKEKRVEREVLMPSTSYGKDGLLLDPSHKLRVCSTCGGFLSVFCDGEKRLATHYTGKQHKGHKAMRDMLEYLERHVDRALRSYSPMRSTGRGLRDDRRLRDYRERGEPLWMRHRGGPGPGSDRGGRWRRDASPRGLKSHSREDFRDYRPRSRSRDMSRRRSRSDSRSMSPRRYSRSPSPERRQSRDRKRLRYSSRSRSPAGHWQRARGYRSYRSPSPPPRGRRRY